MFHIDEIMIYINFNSIVVSFKKKEGKMIRLAGRGKYHKVQSHTIVLGT